MSLVMHEIVGEELAKVKAAVEGLMGTAEADETGYYVYHIRAVEINPEAAQETDWYQEWTINDEPANVIVRYSEDERGDVPDYYVPGVTGWNFILTRNPDGSYSPWEAENDDIGGSGPAFNGHYSLESQRECTEWIDTLVGDDLNDIWL